MPLGVDAEPHKISSSCEPDYSHEYCNRFDLGSFVFALQHLSLQLHHWIVPSALLPLYLPTFEESISCMILPGFGAIKISMEVRCSTSQIIIIINSIKYNIFLQQSN